MFSENAVRVGHTNSINQNTIFQDASPARVNLLYFDGANCQCFIGVLPNLKPDWIPSCLYFEVQYGFLVPNAPPPRVGCAVSHLSFRLATLLTRLPVFAEVLF